MLSLKLAKAGDAEALGKFFSSLFEASTYARVTKYNPKDVEDLVLRLSRDPAQGCTICLYEGDLLVGAMICTSMKQVFNQSEKTAVELGFWITPEHRTSKSLRKILSAYRYWAKRTGCTSILYGKMKDANTVESYVIRKIK